MHYRSRIVIYVQVLDIYYVAAPFYNIISNEIYK